MESALRILLERLDESCIENANVISWGAPVPVFGDPSRSSVATLGLNPSNREFVDTLGNELNGEHRRFHTLKSLGLSQWANINSMQLDKISESCRDYFKRNPYDGWFKALDQIISGTNKSYYNSDSLACHLDLIPFATSCKWTNLTSSQRSFLFELSANSLGEIINESMIKLLVLNGQAVVNSFDRISDINFEKNTMSEWELPRRTGGGVPGFAYRGTVRKIAGVKLKHEVNVLGFNHNIQSSFGVTTKVKSSIRSWIEQSSTEALS